VSQRNVRVLLRFPYQKRPRNLHWIQTFFLFTIMEVTIIASVKFIKTVWYGEKTGFAISITTTNDYKFFIFFLYLLLFERIKFFKIHRISQDM
jgi:hypothetical protein